MKRSIIITGGAGFIGSHVVRLFVNKYPDYKVINLDKLTYAGNLDNLKDIEDRPNYKFVKMDICDFEGVLRLMQEEKVDGIIHLAAESHVDRSIKDPFTFAQTNVMGTLSLLQAAKLYWEPQGWKISSNGAEEGIPTTTPGAEAPVPPTAGSGGPLPLMRPRVAQVAVGTPSPVPCRFYHISTDEVYGALEMTDPEGIVPPFTTKASSVARLACLSSSESFETSASFSSPSARRHRPE